jgi:hypothetical protein
VTAFLAGLATWAALVLAAVAFMNVWGYWRTRGERRARLGLDLEN